WFERDVVECGARNLKSRGGDVDAAGATQRAGYVLDVDPLVKTAVAGRGVEDRRDVVVYHVRDRVPGAYRSFAGTGRIPREADARREVIAVVVKERTACARTREINYRVRIAKRREAADWQQKQPALFCRHGNVFVTQTGVQREISPDAPGVVHVTRRGEVLELLAARLAGDKARGTAGRVERLRRARHGRGQYGQDVARAREIVRSDAAGEEAAAKRVAVARAVETDGVCGDRPGQVERLNVNATVIAAESNLVPAFDPGRVVNHLVIVGPATLRQRILHRVSDEGERYTEAVCELLVREELDVIVVEAEPHLVVHTGGWRPKPRERSAWARRILPHSRQPREWLLNEVE